MSEADLVELKSVAARLETEGSVESLIAWCKVIDTAPADSDARDYLADCLARLRKPPVGDRAAPDSRAIAAPDQLEALARALALAGNWPGALQVWRRIVASGRADVAAWCRAISLIDKARGRTGDRNASRRLRMVAAHAPAHLKVWSQLAFAFAKSGDVESAIVASERQRDLGGETINTHEWRDRLVYSPRRDPARTGPKVLVIGNCQALGLAICLRRVCPTADVAGELWAVHDHPEAAERLLASLDGYDLVISQAFGKPPQAFRSDLLAARARRFVSMPRIMFTGYHPDLVRYLNKDTHPKAIFRAYYSALIAAAFHLGVPQSRVADLFNAYVYGVLGYFDVFAKAWQLQLAEGKRVGFELEALSEEWKQGGAFVHVPDHPKIRVFQSMARAICLREGLEVRPDAELPDDAQQHRMVWPVYPEIAKRLGVEGSLRFTPQNPSTPIGLDEVIAHFYDLYSEAGAPSDKRVLDAAQILRREGV